MKPSGKPKTRCAIYARKSSEEGLEQDFNSLHAQHDACAAYVVSQASEGWELLPERFEDGGYSGGSLDRPALQRLLKKVEDRQVDIIVVYKVDRLTRSLSDFARIIEVLDRRDASFVSVTQAFNTTSSMGRLTLNVLLSFAQFEREVTGERIRDKFAASKRKGMWMGGSPPLGYDPDGRKLIVNEAEADTVRHIFVRYLQLRSVHQLRDDLVGKGVVAKHWISKSGRTHGGTAMNRGALFHLLRNPLYVGEIRHGDKRYPGLHSPIIERETFDAVQALLDEQSAARAGTNARQDALLRGMVFDDRGNPMSPVAARPRRGISYRYYVSSALQTGKRERVGSVGRVSAAALEQIVLDRLAALGLSSVSDGETEASLIKRIEVRRGSIAITIAPEVVHQFEPVRVEVLKAKGDKLEVAGNVYRLLITAAFRRHGGKKLVIRPNGDAEQGASHDPALLKALARAESWKRDLLLRNASTLEEIATAEGLQPSYARRILRLAFLAPDLKWAILKGRCPAGMSLERLRRSILPDLWAAQWRMIARIGQ